MPRVPPFPVEILDQVVCCAFLMLASGCRRPSLAPVAGLSLACKESRAIVMRRWFLTRPAVRIKDQRDWNMVGALKMWIREISCTDSGVRLCKCLPPSLLQLRTVQLDFNNHTPFQFYKAYTRILSSLPLGLASLTLNSLPIINKSLLQDVAAKFVQLTDLRLSTVGRLVADTSDSCCCSACPRKGERQRLLSVQHSPIPDAFPDALRLGHAFGTYLAPLTSLKTLHLGIYLSPEHILNEHSEHDGEHDFDSAGITSNPLARFADCPECCMNYAASTRRSEKHASVALSKHLPSLETIEWASCFVLLKRLWDEEELLEAWGTTKLGVVRDGIKVKAERIPEVIYGYEWNYGDQWEYGDRRNYGDQWSYTL